MPNTLFLHLGLHKTASTSFQETCRTNQKQLKKQGFIYPLFYCRQANKTEISNHSIPIRSAFGNNPTSYWINQIWGIKDIEQTNNSYKQQLASALKSGDNLILSGEGISLLSEQELLNFTRFVKEFNYDIKAFGLVRPPLEFATSAYQEMIKGGDHFPLISFGNFTTSYLTDTSQKIPTRSLQISTLRKIFETNIEFQPFHKACAHPMGPTAYILERIGVSSNSIKTAEKQNKSMSNLQTRLQNFINKAEPKVINGTININHRQIIHMPISRGNNCKFHLNKNEYDLVSDQIENCRSYYKKLLGADFLDDTIHLSKPIKNQTIIEIFNDFLVPQQ